MGCDESNLYSMVMTKAAKNSSQFERDVLGRGMGRVAAKSFIFVISRNTKSKFGQHLAIFQKNVKKYLFLGHNVHSFILKAQE